MKIDNLERYLLIWRKRLRRLFRILKSLRSSRKPSSNKTKRLSVYQLISQLKSHWMRSIEIRLRKWWKKDH